jgi:hypothetical protein
MPTDHQANDHLTALQHAAYRAFIDVPAVDLDEQRGLAPDMEFWLTAVADRLWAAGYASLREAPADELPLLLAAAVDYPPIDWTLAEEAAATVRERLLMGSQSAP